MDALCNTHVKLLAFDFLNLAPNPEDTNSCFRKGKLLSRAEIVGIVVTRDFKPGTFLKFDIDDGTGCVTCVLWLNHLTSSYFSWHNPSDVQQIACSANKFASDIQIGVLARVSGRITNYHGNFEITVSDVLLERDPNVQILHWLSCIKLARKCYDP